MSQFAAIARGEDVFHGRETYLALEPGLSHLFNALGLLEPPGAWGLVPESLTIFSRSPPGKHSPSSLDLLRPFVADLSCHVTMARFILTCIAATKSLSVAVLQTWGEDLVEHKEDISRKAKDRNAARQDTGER